MAAPCRPLGKGVRRAPPDRGRHLAHALDQAAAAGGHLGAQAACGPAGDVLGQVAVALHVGEHAQDGHQLPALVGRGLAVHQLVLHGVEILPDDVVDDLVALDQYFGRLAVTGQECVGGTGDAFADQGEDLSEEPVDLVRHGDGRPERLFHDQGPQNGRCHLFLFGSL